jgi:iron(III) transport system substrate-binding protein
MNQASRGRLLAALALCIGVADGAAAQAQQLTAICSTDQSWCELAAKEYQAQTGVRVQQVRKATGEALAQIRAEAANPKTDLWWGGTGDPYLQAAEVGLLEAYRPSYLNDLQGWAVRQYAMSGNLVGGFYTSAIGFGWNEDVLRKKNLPPPEVLVRPDRPEVQGRDRDLASGLERYRLHHPCRPGADDGRGRVFEYLKKLHRNITQYTRSGTAQAKSIAKGEVGIGLSFILASRTSASRALHDGEERGAVRRHQLRDRRHRPDQGRPQPRGGEKYYDWLMSPAGQSLGAKANSAPVPGEQDLQGRSEDPDPRQRAPHQVRLREVRQGGGAQAPDRALGKGSELAAALRARRLERSPTDASARGHGRRAGDSTHVPDAARVDLSFLRCVPRPTSVANLSC